MKEIVINKVSRTTSPGKDGVNGLKFLKNINSELDLIVRKLDSGDYGFTPYLEMLFLKGRNKLPRTISKPSIRDKVALSYINQTLQNSLHPDYALPLPSKVTRELNEVYMNLDPTKYSFIKLDIKDYYGSIPHSLLFPKLKSYLDNKLFNNVVKALRTPTLNKFESINSINKVSLMGIQQGLPISNILSSFYLNDFDTKLSKRNVYYFRYVDDILIICTNNLLKSTIAYSENELENIGLKVNEKKDFGRLSKSFEYLGYLYSDKKISVRQSSIDKLLSSIFSLISKAEHTRITKLWNNIKVSDEEISDILMRNINLKVAGAISEKRKYGWVPYFSEINDLNLLFRLDSIIKNKLKKINHLPLSNITLKRIARAYHEFRHNPKNNYALNFDNISTRKEKLDFFNDYGLLRLKQGETLTPEEINSYFENFKKNQLRSLDKDIGFLS